MKFSVVILTYNRISNLLLCLNSAISQNYPKTHYEIIIVDDCSSDDTPKYVDEFIKKNSKNFVIKYLRHDKNKGVAAARNTGIENSSMDYICFLADDYVLPNDYLQYSNNFFQKNKMAEALRFRIVNHNAKSFFSNLNFLYLDYSIMQKVSSTVSFPVITDLPASGAAIFSKKIFTNVGKFDEKLRGGEDSEFAIKLKKASIALYFDPNKTVGAYFPESLMSSYKNKFNYGMSYFKFSSLGCGVYNLIKKLLIRLKSIPFQSYRRVEKITGWKKIPYYFFMLQIEFIHMLGFFYAGLKLSNPKYKAKI